MKPITRAFQPVAALCFIAYFWATPIVAQTISTDLAAIGYNDKIAIKVTNMTTFSNYFALENGAVDLEFYFDPEDPRNGTYTGAPITQPNGEVYIRFGQLAYQAGDTLTFILTESLANTTRYYVFVRGDFFPESGGPIDACPRYFTCKPKYLSFFFEPSEIILDPSSLGPVKIEIPSAGVNSIKTGYIDVANNAIRLYFLPSLNCSQAMLGTATFTINGMTCTFENGQLSCPPWANIPQNLNNDCAPYFENCALELIDLLEDAKYTLPCQQWVYYTACNTGAFIHRNGPVSIGTATAAPNAALTVKNGIITDKLKVTNDGWADYVFEKGYDLMPLEQVEAYIAKYHHLPGTPSADKVEANGSFELGETTIDQQVKIEEIFLHLIEMEEETKALESVLFLREIREKLRII